MSPGIYYRGESEAVQTKHNFTPEEWRVIAEIEAICRPLCRLSISVQEESKTTQSLFWLQSLKASHVCIEKGLYSVVDLNAGDEMINATATRGWDGKTGFQNLSMIMKRSAARSESHPDMKPLSDIGEKLIKRLNLEFDRYFQEPTESQLVSMTCNPLMVTMGKHGLPCFKGQTGVWDSAVELLTEEVVLEAKRCFESGVEQAEAVPLQHTDQECESNSDIDDDDDIFSSVKEKLGNNELFPSAETISAQGYEAIAQNEIKAWLELSVNWQEVAKKQNPEKSLMNQDKFHIVLYVSEFVDIFIWWKDHAEQFPLVSAVAARYLARPEASGFQERVFGMGSTVDTPLRRRLGKRKFEMLVLLRRNAEFLQKVLESGIVNGQSENVNPLLDSYFDSMDEEHS